MKGENPVYKVTQNQIH